MTAPIAGRDRDDARDRAELSDRAHAPGYVSGDLRDRAGVPHVPSERRERSPAWPLLRGVRAAFAFFTRIPAGGFPYGDRELAWAPAHAPFVGALLGGALGALYVCLLPLGALAAATLALGVSMLLTGALHEDGLADTSDALGGGHEPAKVFAILKDSRIGAFGAAAIAVSVLARAALLGQLGPSTLWAFPLAWCAARVGPVWLMVILPYVTPSQGKSERLVRAGWRQALVASSWFVAVALVTLAEGAVDAARIFTVTAAVGSVTAISGFRFYRRVGGVTGDFLGAAEQLGEIAALAACAWPL